MKTQIIFTKGSEGEEIFHQEDLVELFPYGLSMTTDASRPFLLLKDKTHTVTLPVAVSPIEAGVALSQSNKKNLQASPHKFTAQLMTSLGMEVKQCVFVEIKGSHQYVRLYMSGHTTQSSFKLRADEAMSLCLHLEVPIFASKNFISRSRIMSTEVEALSKKIQGLGLPENKGYYLN